MDTNDKANINSLASRNIPSASTGYGTPPVSPNLFNAQTSPYNINYNDKAVQQKAEHLQNKNKEDKQYYDDWAKEQFAPPEPTAKEKLNNWIATQKDKQNLKADKERAKYEKTPVEYPRNELPTGGGEQSLDDKIHGINYLQEGADTGRKASEVIQDADIPKYKRATFKDLMYDPQWEGKRDSLIGNAIGTALGSGLARMGGTDLGAESALSKYNKEQMANYSAMQADKDQRALDANLSDIETLNAQKVAMEANLADTIANTYIERYNTLQTNETKRQLVNQMVKDSDKLFNDPNLLGGKDADQKILNLATLMGLYAGDFSISARLIQKYAPQLIATFDKLMYKLTGGKWDGLDPNTENPDTSGEPEPKKKDKPITSTGAYPTLEGFDPINDEDYKSDPTAYIVIPQNDGSDIYLRKMGSWDAVDKRIHPYTDAQKKQVAQAIIDSRIPWDKKQEVADAFGGWQGPDITVSHPVKTAVTEHNKTEKAIKDYNSNTLKAIDAEKINLSTGKDPQKTLDWLAKNPLNTEYADVFTKSQYEGLEESAHKQKIDRQYSIIDSSNWSDERKITEYSDLLNTEGQYMDSQTKTNINRKIQNAKDQMYVYKPYLNATNNAIFEATKNGKSGWTINADGSVHYEHKGVGKSTPLPQDQKGDVDPATLDFGYSTTTQKFFIEFIKQLDPEVVASNLPGATSSDKNAYFYTTGTYKVLKNLMKNPYIPEYAVKKDNKGQYVNEDFNKAYTQMKEYWQKANSGHYFAGVIN